jgi:hypothetical protein
MSDTMRRDAESPFLPISPAWRVGIISYLLIYQILFPLLAAMFNPEAAPLLLPRFAVESARVLLTCWPLFFYRREYGFLHPLLLPLLVGIFEGITRFPLHLIAPLSIPLIDYSATSLSAAIPLRLDAGGLAAVKLYYGGVHLLATACYFLGYFLLNIFRAPSLQVRPPRNLTAICLLATLFCVSVGLFYIQFVAGGLSNHLIAMRMGRAALFQGQGPFLILGEFSFVAVILWFGYLQKPFRNPFWLASFVAACALTLVMSGSRSSVIYALVVLLMLWWQKRRRVLLMPSAILAVVTLLIFAIFGSIRQDWGSTTINTSVFAVSSFSENIQRAQEEIQSRKNEDGDLAGFAGVRDSGLLWGRSYVAAIAFWVPRALWPDKPHGAGAYNMWVNYAGQRLDQFGTGVYWGIPVGAVTEAFWNFHLGGVVVFFLVFGAFHKWLAKLVLKHPHSPFVLVLSTWIVMNFAGDTTSFVTTIQDVTLLLVLAFLLGIFRFAKPFNARLGLTVRPQR